MKVSRRRFVSSSAGAMVAAGLGAEARAMLPDDVPASPNFSALPLKGNSTWEKLAESNVSDLMKAAARRAPRGAAQFYKRMRLKLTAAYRQLHNEMHRNGHYHGHTQLTDHPQQRP
jgi:hypothetical protein